MTPTLSSHLSRCKHIHGYLVLSLLGLLIAPVLAQTSIETWPTKPIRFIAPTTPGGGNDTLSRMLSPRMSQTWGQQVVVDLRPGAGGIIGTEIAAKSPPDGHTLLIVAGGYTMNPYLYKKLPYDTYKDFERVSVVAFSPNVLVSHPSVPAKSIHELIQLAKTRPNTLNYASSGMGTTSYLSAGMFAHLTGTKMTHVAYKGAGAAGTAVVSGEVHLIFTAPSITVPFVKQNRLRALGVTGNKRMDLLPETPAIGEIVAGYEVQNFFGVLVSAKTPRAIIDKVYLEIARIVRLPEVKEQLISQGFIPSGNTPQEFNQLVQNDLDRWAKLLPAMGIKPE